MAEELPVHDARLRVRGKTPVAFCVIFSLKGVCCRTSPADSLDAAPLSSNLRTAASPPLGLLGAASSPTTNDLRYPVASFNDAN